MNLKKSKALRKIIYRGVNFRERKYVRDPKSGTIFAVEHRRAYQDAKKQLKEKGM